MTDETVHLTLTRADADRIARCLTRLGEMVQQRPSAIGGVLEELEPDRPRTMSRARQQQFMAAAVELGADARRLAEEVLRPQLERGAAPERF